ncbi:hypothetical protein MKX03_036469, partial [Papaver bracteatum]
YSSCCNLGTKVKTGQNNSEIKLIVTALGCLGAAFSTSPPSSQLKDILQEGISAGRQSVLAMIFQFSERVTNPTISFEALQVLRAVSHNYPNIMVACWMQVSTITFELLKLNVATPDVPIPEGLTTLSRGDVGISPSHGLDISKGDHLADSTGNEQWSEAIEKHLPLILRQRSPMVRASAVTCFAGVTSYVFFSLVKEKQDLILSSSIRMALHDEVASVRSAASSKPRISVRTNLVWEHADHQRNLRVHTIGVIACFPQISYRSEILDKFIHACEKNTHDPLVSSICDALRHRASDLEEFSEDLRTDSQRIDLLADCALRLTKDNDKIFKINYQSTIQNEATGFVDSSLAKPRTDTPLPKSDPIACHSSHASFSLSGSAPRRR